MADPGDPRADGTDPELEFYRAVEDLFATLRGVPHLMSPRDFQLLRSWWRDEVPLAAVTTGVTEVFARRRERGEADPVVSLGYCRHAVRRHARRMAQMAAGRASPVDDPDAGGDAVRTEVLALADRLSAVVRAQAEGRPRVAAAVDSIRRQLAAAEDLGAAEAGELLFSLEGSLLQACLEALDGPERKALEARVGELAEAGDDPAQQRRRLALRDRELRVLLLLPRLELR